MGVIGNAVAVTVGELIGKSLIEQYGGGAPADRGSH